MLDIMIQLLWFWAIGLFLGAMVILTYAMWNFFVAMFKGEL